MCFADYFIDVDGIITSTWFIMKKANSPKVQAEWGENKESRQERVKGSAREDLGNLACYCSSESGLGNLRLTCLLV